MRQKSRKGDFWKRGTINLILDTIKSLTVRTELILKSPGCDLEIKSASRATLIFFHQTKQKKYNRLSNNFLMNRNSDERPL